MVVIDKNSSANFHDVIINHIDFRWDIDFDKKIISGLATYYAKILNDTEQIILDGHSLEILDVLYNEVSSRFSVENVGSIYGQKIILFFGKLVAGKNISFSIKYVTSPTANALQFINKELTSDKKEPFLYSQCQSIFTRSILPCMDTPSVKQTYKAEVSVPSNLTCLMSALSISNELDEIDRSIAKYSFSQPIAIPSYLVAIVVGLLEKREISKRCVIWAEPSMVEKARWEFEDTERMVEACEELVGKYVWTRYDMVLLPPFFPFGGMENPMLTFLTSSLITGDRSMTNVVAHEIAHSWTGNLVTNATWEHFWINEGFTVFLERKILAKLYGETERQFASVCGWEDNLIPTIYNIFSVTHEYTKLIPNLENRDPEDIVNAIPYEKGSALLLFLEQQLGADKFEMFLKSYIENFAQKSIVSNEFKDYLFDYFSDQKSVLESIDFEKWFHEPGVPPNKPKYDYLLIQECIDLANKWLNSNGEEIKNVNDYNFKNMSSIKKEKVLKYIEQCGKLTSKQAAFLDEKYSLSALTNCDILSTWITVSLKANYKPIIDVALKFVVQQGRLKYIKPIYKALFEWEETRSKAINLFQENKSFMHPISVNIIKSILDDHK